MNLTECVQVIAMIATYNPYQPKAADPEQARQELKSQAQAWLLAIQHSAPKLTIAAACEAVVRYHAETSGRPMAVADLIRIGSAIQAEERAEAHREAMRARHALPAEMRREPQPTRDRSEDLRALIAGLMARYRNWDEVGDPGTRERQAAMHPELAEKHQQARHARAMAIARERSAERARRVAAGLDPIGYGDE